MAPRQHAPDRTSPRVFTERYHPEVQFVDAPGPLWIGVFIRERHTVDTSARMVEILRQVADAKEFLGKEELAAQRRNMAGDVVGGMNERLWKEDHYVTRIHPDGKIRDLVDYVASLPAVASGSAPPTGRRRSTNAWIQDPVGTLDRRTSPRPTTDPKTAIRATLT